MIQFTRRTFLQSSLATGLVAAAEATRSRWLLSSAGPVRIGIAGLGASATQHLALFAAIPGAEIAGLADSEPTRTAQALRQLRELGQVAPAVYRDLDRMLENPTLQAISLPNQTAEAGPILHRVIAAGLPVLSDFPPSVESPESVRLYEAVLSAPAPVHFRLADFTYPTSASDLMAWLKRSGSKTAEAHLFIPRMATLQELRVAAIAATDALLAASSLSQDRLIRWVGTKDARSEMSAAGTIGNIALPQNSFGISALRVHLLGVLQQNSKFVVQHRSGSMEFAISSLPDADSSLQTAMKFLNCARRRSRTDNVIGSRAHVAAAVVDHMMNHLSPAQLYR
jgi:hypothetical protein